MFHYTDRELEEALNKFFVSDNPMVLNVLPKKQKDKYLCFLWIRTLFDQQQTYDEKEVNNILKPVYKDYVMLRRYLIDYQLLKRYEDGSKYWVMPIGKHHE